MTTRRNISIARPEAKQGEVPLHRVPVYDHKMQLRGHVAKSATSIGAARILGTFNAELKSKDGRLAWHGKAPPPNPTPKIAQQPQQQPRIVIQASKFDQPSKKQNVDSAKGSVKKK